MARHKINVRGRIIPNDYKWFYDWFEEDSTCPRDVQKVLDQAADGDDVDVYISSPGGIISSGSDIYTMLRSAGDRLNIMIHITGEAHSAASVIACAARSEMSPTALMMVHCVSSGAVGNHSVLEKEAEVLRTADRALCTAYMAKAGMTEEEALEMMEHETWLTAQQAKDRGLVDEIMFEEAEELPLTASVGTFRLPTSDQMAKVRAMMGEDLSPAKEQTAPGYADAIRRTREAEKLSATAGRFIGRH